MIPSSHPAVANSRATASQNPETAVYAYTITRWPTAVPAAPVRALTYRDIALVVADVDPAEFTDPAMLPLVRRHHGVIVELFEAASVLPFRFATMFTDDDAARQLLRDAYDEAVAALDALAGHREWGVRVRRPKAVPPDGLSGTDYLALRRRERSGGDQLHERLARHAGRSTIRRSTAEFGLDAVYLVPLSGEDEFLAEADRIDGPVEITGPWPPYSFSELRTTAR